MQNKKTLIADGFKPFASVCPDTFLPSSSFRAGHYFFGASRVSLLALKVNLLGEGKNV
jgi:hypothetical protein